jgi:hypothetical protein
MSNNSKCEGALNVLDINENGPTSTKQWKQLMTSIINNGAGNMQDGMA